jgi:hypothetical protein
MHTMPVDLNTGIHNDSPTITFKVDVECGFEKYD